MADKHRNNKISPRKNNSIALFLLILATQCIGSSTCLHLNMIATPLPSSTTLSIPKFDIATVQLEHKPSTDTLEVPTIKLSTSSIKSLNTIYYPRNAHDIPRGFARMCNKSGGYAPRPIWNELTNKVTPWFESSNYEYIYFNCHDRLWYVDNSMGMGCYLSKPESLLLPPLGGWVDLTGRRSGAPKMEFLDSPSEE